MTKVNGNFENRIYIYIYIYIYTLRIRFYFLKKLSYKSTTCNHVRQKLNLSLESSIKHQKSYFSSLLVSFSGL